MRRGWAPVAVLVPVLVAAAFLLLRNEQDAATARLEARVAELETRLTQRQRAIERLQADVSRETDRNAALRKELRDRHETIAELQREIDRRRLLIARLQEEIDRLSREKR